MSVNKKIKFAEIYNKSKHLFLCLHVGLVSGTITVDLLYHTEDTVRLEDLLMLALIVLVASVSICEYTFCLSNWICGSHHAILKYYILTAGYLK